MQQSSYNVSRRSIFRAFKKAFFALLIFFTVSTVQAGETGHWGPGVSNIRDLVVPDAGLYVTVYNYYYMSDRLNDADGNSINTVTVGQAPGPNATFAIDRDLDNYVLAPTLVWITPWKILGAKYGAILSPSFSNTSIGASLSNQTGAAISADESQFAAGDMFVQPVWLGWTLEHWDFAFGYGFHAPIGKYDTVTTTLPVVGPRHVESNTNVGLGFWTHQLQGAVSYYPWIDKSMSVIAALTYEFHGDKDDFDLTPGQDLTLNWGLSQYFPLGGEKSFRLEVGPKGYSTWQTTDDSGFDAAQPPAKDEVHAIGAQIGLAYLPWNGAALNFIYQNEFHSEDRYDGQSFGLNFSIKAL